MINLRVVDLTVELTDLATEITKYAIKFKNTYTQDNKQLFQIIGQIHGAMLLNIDLFTLSCCLILAGSSRFCNINDSTRSRLDYILYVPIRALVPKTSTDEHLQKS